MSFIKYDIIILILFVLFVSLFLYRNRKNLKKEGLLFLYKAKWGITLIDKTAKKFPKVLKFLSHISIGVGYLLMAGMLYLFGKIVYLYIVYPSIVREIKIPPIMPLIPYIDKIVPNAIGLPPFYFVYFIIILAIIAISHEFAHGIFMRRYNIHIKSTGFGFFPFFLPVFLAAFVEQDEKSMVKASKFQQKAVLAAGTFANILTAILFFGILILFFSFAFNPSGVVFDNYAYTAVGVGAISRVNNTPIENASYEKILKLTNEKGFTKIQTSEEDYLITKDFLEIQKNNSEFIAVYFDAPAINAELTGAILEIEDSKIQSLEDLSKTLEKYSSGDKVNIKTNEGQYQIILDENPETGKAWLGINFNNLERSSVFGKFMNFLTSFKKPHVFYEPAFRTSKFIYDFIWWLVLISLSVALVNMLPMGIFDGGRFFYLTMWQITGSEKKAKKWFSYVTYFLLGLLFVLMAFWAFSFI